VIERVKTLPQAFKKLKSKGYNPSHV